MITIPKTHYILGATGFIGKHVVAKLLSQGVRVVELNRPQYDFLHPQSLFRLDYDDSVIIDCATLADGNEDEIRSVVLDGPQAFTEFLAGKRVRYIYFSTSTVTNEKIVQANMYVRYKREMEKAILSLNNSSIIRLTFPFGPNESANRLVSRLITSAKKGETLKIGDIRLPLTPIPFLLDNLLALLQSEKRITNFTDGAVYELKMIAEAIFSALDMQPDYQLDRDNVHDFSIAEPNIYPNNHDPIMLIKQMARTS